MTMWPHGDISDAELRSRGIDPNTVVDFAVNVDPRGPHPIVQTAWVQANVSRYPDPHARQLRAALAKRDRVEPESICVGAGATNILWNLMRLAPQQARVLIPAHTFHEYSAAAIAAGMTVDELPRSLSNGLAIDLHLIDAWAAHPAAHTVLLGSPDNPSGDVLDYEELERIALRHPQLTLVLDEAFLRLSYAHELVFRSLPSNVIRVRALTKELGIPGLRVGYAVAEPTRVQAMLALTPPWSTSAPAQAAAQAGIANPTIVAEVRRRMLSDTAALRAELEQAGFAPLPTQTVYTLIEVNNATRWAQAVERHSVLVRDCTSFGLPNHLRLCGRHATDRERLLHALLDARKGLP